MEKKEKLMLVFDFLAEYLTKETESSDNGALSKAYDIMKKVDEMDKTDAKISSAVKSAIKKVKEETKSILETEKALEDSLSNEDTPFESQPQLSETFKQRTGVTLDAEGKLVEVKVGPIKEYTTISKVMDEINK